MTLTPLYRRVTTAGQYVEVVDYHDRHFADIGPPRKPRVYGLSDSKREDNVRAARSRARLIALSNWAPERTYFFTTTFRDDVRELKDAVKAWEKFRRILVDKYPDVRYLVIPEVQPRSKKWHFHALLFNLPYEKDFIARFGWHEFEGRKENGKKNYVPAYKRHFKDLWSRACGHSGEIGDDDRTDMQALRHAGGTVWYITKYITKNTADVIPVGSKFYYAGGRGLVRPKIEKHKSKHVGLLCNDDGTYQECVIDKEIPDPPASGHYEYGISKLQGPYGRVTYSRYLLPSL